MLYLLIYVSLEVTRKTLIKCEDDVMFGVMPSSSNLETQFSIAAFLFEDFKC
jgi:DNA-binding XRE family transcriptional regulator